MIDGVLNTATFFMAVWDPSILSLGYSIFGIIMCLMNFKKDLLSGGIYRNLCIYSLLVFGAKFIIILVYWVNPHLDIFSSTKPYKMFGIHLENSVNSRLFLNVYKELIGLIIGVLGIMYRAKLSKNPRDLIRGSVMGLAVLLNLLLVAISNYSLMNTAYFAMAIIWISFWGYRVNERFLLLSMTILAVFTIIQMIVSAIYTLAISDSASNEVALKIGLLTITNGTYLSYISTFTLYFTTISFIRRLFIRRLDRHPDGTPNLDSKLLKKSDEDDELPSIFNQILDYLSFTLVYGVCVFNIFLWIVNLHGYIQILMILWLFYSIIELNIERLMFLTRKLFIPVLFFDCCLLYIINLFKYKPDYFLGNYVLENSPAYVIYEIWTISMFLLLQRRYKKKKYDISKTSITMNLIIGLVLEHSNKIALIVVFTIGLSKINLFHVGFMAIFMVFMLNSRVAREYWMVLVVYSEIIIACDYIYGLIYSLDGDMNTIVKELIGFDSARLTAVVFPNDYLLWMLLLSAAMQLSAYRSSYLRNKNDAIQTGHESKVIALFAKLYNWIKYLFIWIVYTALFLTIFMASPNILNGIRLVILLVLFSMHVLKTSQSLHVNVERVEKYWYVFIYYSGVVLVLRYLFQFNKFTNIDLNSEFIGLQVYSDQGLYENMVTDCIILFVSVYHKNLSSRHNFSQSNSAEFFSVTKLIQQKTIKPSVVYGKLKELGSKYFVYAYICVILITAVFWRLSVTMILYVATIIVYIAAVERHISKSIRTNTEKSLETLVTYRVRLWKVMTLLTMAFLITSFCCFFISKDIEKDYNRWVWAYFIMGFSIKDGYLLESSYEYLMIFILLAIERNLIDDIKFEILPDSTPKNPKISMFFKVAIESFMPSLVMAIAFYKLTLVSVIYVAITVFCIKISPLTRTRVLMYTLMVVSLLQYLVLIVNLSKYDSSYTVPEDYDPPWKKIGLAYNNDVMMYLNLGSNIGQTYGLVGDFMGILLSGIFFTLFAMAQSDIAQIMAEGNAKQAKNHRNLKEAMYSSMHFAILFVVLIFVSESIGFFSLIYCIFCLVNVFRATKILKSVSNFKKYLKLLGGFLIPFMCFELLLQCSYQAPFHYYLNDYDEEWINAVGLTRLWSAGGGKLNGLQDRWKRIYFKIFTLGFILLVFWLMNTEDYADFVEKLSKKYRIKAKMLGLEIAQAFNDYRLKELKKHEERRIRAENELEKLDENVKKWNEKFIESRQVEFGVNPNRGDKIIETNTYLELEMQHKPGMARSFQNAIIGSINPVLFKHFIFRITLKRDTAVMEELKERQSKSVGDISDASMSAEQIEKEKLLIKFKKNQHIYVLSWKDWMKIIFYVLCSCTQGIVFLTFFINHFVYASIESVIFPLSVLCYGLLEYPRPSPNYFRIMLIYTEFVFFLKFVINLYVWDFVSTGDYQDPAKTGFNIASRTYSVDLTMYILFDAICILALISHEYFLVRCGLNEHTEFELESLDQAKIRNQTGGSAINFRKSLVYKEDKRPKLALSERVKRFLHKIGNSDPEEKPGYDYYTRTFLIQLILLIFLLFFFTQMNGESGNISNILA